MFYCYCKCNLSLPLLNRNYYYKLFSDILCFYFTAQIPPQYLKTTIYGHGRMPLVPSSPTCDQSYGRINSSSNAHVLFDFGRDVLIKEVTLVVKEIIGHVPDYRFNISDLYSPDGICKYQYYYQSGYSSGYFNIIVSCNFIGRYFSMFGKTTKDTIDICSIRVYGGTGKFFFLTTFVLLKLLGI